MKNAYSRSEMVGFDKNKKDIRGRAEETNNQYYIPVNRKEPLNEHAGAFCQPYEAANEGFPNKWKRWWILILTRISDHGSTIHRTNFSYLS